MKNRIFFFITFTSALLSCSGVRVLNTEADPGFDLNQYKTFDFFELEASGDTTENFAKNANLIKESITRELQGKGLNQSANSPDLLVNIGITVEEKVQTRETNIRDAPRYMGQRNYSWKSEEIEVRRYQEGTVTVDLVEPSSKKMVWHGAVEGTIPDKKDKLPATIDEAMEKLFAELQQN